ncbi:hypothetical protein E1295_05925 [Nonomuraea mesophila]|uniref:Uncharacterized protein n=1 Tax=Nonomuraea mesophila TaxID=2530382 RepID=A0A4R5FUZ4_9ACTN|nr:hypothetical protein [Nonomuraea mesophila]TDE58147.1 hypothetical protein E1295_05925 [Nonomuraea mesophila]
MTRRNQFPDFHGPHAEPPKPDRVTLTWHEPSIRVPRIRVVSHTCQCQAVTYELCAAAGQAFVRRTDRGTGAVHETAWSLTSAAMRTFTQILEGEAR